MRATGLRHPHLVAAEQLSAAAPAAGRRKAFIVLDHEIRLVCDELRIDAEDVAQPALGLSLGVEAAAQLSD